MGDIVNLDEVRRAWVAAVKRCASCGRRSLDVVFERGAGSITHECVPCGATEAVVEVELCPPTTRAEAEDIVRNHGAQLDDVESW